MLKRSWVPAMACSILAHLGFNAQAVELRLFEYVVNLDGTIIYQSDPLPLNVDASGFDFATGLGTIRVTLSGAGAHYAGLFVDHDIDEGENTFFNEIGMDNGVPVNELVGVQSWEIDEPGYVFGDIYFNFLTSSLDNANGLSGPEDVSMALAWSFNLLANQEAIIDFVLSESAPTSGFFLDFNLSHEDPDSDYLIYFSSSIQVHSVTSPVPSTESTSSLLFAAFASLAAYRWRSRRNPALPS
jgi:hypothetical protein